MLLLHDIAGLSQVPRGCALSIGNYDGVHRGHAAIISALRNFAHEDDVHAGRCATGSSVPTGSESTESPEPICVVTFEPHPLTVLKPQLAPPRLTPPAVKRRVLESLGVTHLVELPPSPDVLNLSAADFFGVLRDTVQPSHIVEGPRFNFGKGRAGNVQRMIEWSVGTEILVHALAGEEVALLDLSLVEVSSTLIRWLIAHGRVRDAAICLGRPYTLVGEVIKGFQRGRTIGIPTANLDVKDQLVPLDGVYAGRALVNGQVHAAAVSIGSLPTFAQRAFQIEAHLLDFDADLYGQTIELELIDLLREQRAYGSVDALKVQIERDIEQIRSMQQLDPARAIVHA